MSTTAPRPRSSTSKRSSSRSRASGSSSARTGESTESREQRKARTRRALLDSALELLDDAGYASLSLREVSKGAGIVPTAFYRHFHDLDELGLALVEESVGTLHDLLRAARSGVTDPLHVVRPSLGILAVHVAAHRRHFRFLARERSGGSAALRQAIRREIRLFATELAVDLVRDPKRAAWPTADIQMLADVLVTLIVATIEQLSDTDHDAESQEAIVDQAARQLTLVLLGARAWKPKRD